MIYVVDLDGTVANNAHREGFIQGDVKDWDAFYRADLIALDEPIPRAVKVLRHFLLSGIHFLYLTGRPDRNYCRQATQDWLASNGIWQPLYMRPGKDFCPAVEFKERIILGLEAEFDLDPDLVFIDDDLRNTEMYARHGVFLKAPECWDNFVLPGDPQ